MFKKIKSIIKTRIRSVVLEEIEKDRIDIKQLSKLQNDSNNALEVINNQQEEQYKDLITKHEQISSLYKVGIGEINHKIEHINQDSCKLNQDVDTVNKMVNGLSGNIDAINHNINNINQEIDNIKETNIANNKITLEELNKYIDDINKYIEDLKEKNLADENDFKAFYNLLLRREPENSAIRIGQVLRKDLFNSIIFSEEYKLLSSTNDDKPIENLWDKPTYSQAGEDSILFYIFKMLDIQYKDITYLDLGANHAKDLSNTYFFYEKGASGVLVEANPNLCESLKKERERDIIINKCVSTDSGQSLDFYILNGDGLSSPDKRTIDEALSKNPELKIEEIIKVKSISVNDIIKNYFSDKAPTILNIDIEGNEIEILESIDFNNFRPVVVICEVIPYDTKLVIGKKNEIVMKIIRENNYEEYAFTGINSIFIDGKMLRRCLDEKENSFS